MVQKLLIDTDDFLSPCFQCFRELVAFVLTVDCGSSAMKGMIIKIMKKITDLFLKIARLEECEFKELPIQISRFWPTLCAS